MTRKLLPVSIIFILFFMPFGGRVLSVNAPVPAGPCASASITVGLPTPGIFMIPAVKSYLFGTYSKPGSWVVGIASSRFCGVILGVGSSLF